MKMRKSASQKWIFCCEGVSARRRRTRRATRAVASPSVGRTMPKPSAATRRRERESVLRMAPNSTAATVVPYGRKPESLNAA
jgi:hypothetical protein